MKYVLLFLFCLAAVSGDAQEKLIATVDIRNIESAYVDRPGDLYLLQKGNNLKKISTDGTLVLEQNFPSSLLLFEPRDGARMFACFNTTHCAFFSEGTNQEITIEPQYAIEPALICSSGDHCIWILDRSDWSLKKINPVQSKVMAETLIDQEQFQGTPQFTFMREYQNFLFTIEKNAGILVFNGIGKQIKKIEAPGIEYFNFIGEELYYKKNDKLIFYDLFDATTREVPVEAVCKYILLTDARKYLVYENRVDIFENH